AIRKKICHSVAWNNEHCEIDLSLKELGSKMNQIYGHHVAPSGHLHLNADTNIAGASIDCLPFDPVHTAGLFLRPSAGGAEPLVDYATHSGRAVGVLALFD